MFHRLYYFKIDVPFLHRKNTPLFTVVSTSKVLEELVTDNLHMKLLSEIGLVLPTQ